MSKASIESCKQILEAKRTELLANHHSAEDIAGERVPDSTDEISLEVQRSIQVDGLSRKAALFRQVAEALERIARGEYGVCLGCQEEISPKRLAALPWAALCYQCQQLEENRSDTDTNGIVDQPLEFAASNTGQPRAEWSRRHGYRLRRHVALGASRRGEATKSEARL